MLPKAHSFEVPVRMKETNIRIGGGIEARLLEETWCESINLNHVSVRCVFARIGISKHVKIRLINILQRVEFISSKLHVITGIRFIEIMALTGLPGIVSVRNSPTNGEFRRYCLANVSATVNVFILKWTFCRNKDSWYSTLIVACIDWEIQKTVLLYGEPGNFKVAENCFIT